MDMIKIGFIGAGNMAGALIGGILGSRKNCVIAAYDKDLSKTRVLPDSVLICEDIAEVFRQAEYIVFAVKPQSLAEVFSDINLEDGIDLTSKVLVTMAAGVSCDYFFHGLGHNALKIVRIMPNTPMMLGLGATAMCATEEVSAAQRQVVRELLECCGMVREISETQMNAVISVNGSSPAYLFLLAKAVTEFARSQGIAEKDALDLFAQTMAGSAKMLTSSGKTPDELIQMVASPGGTTLAALRTLEEKKFETIIQEAMQACTDRAEELGK